MIFDRLKKGFCALALLGMLSWPALAFAADETPPPDPGTIGAATDKDQQGTTTKDTGTAGTLSEGGTGLAIPTGDVKLSTAISQKSFAETVISIVNYFIGFLGFIAVVFIIYAGVLMVVSAGNEEAVTKGKKIMTYAAVGFMVIILSFSFVNFLAGAVPSGAPAPAGDETEGPITIVTCNNDNPCTNPLKQCINNICVDKPVGGITSDTAIPAVNPNLDAIDKLMAGLADALDVDSASLSSDERDLVQEALATGSIDDKIEKLKGLRDSPDTGVRFLGVIERLIDGLERLKSLRDEMDKVKENMPESKDTVAKYEEASEALNKLIDAPTDKVQFRRFESRYKELKDLIRKFPLVQARIRAIPGEGNVPFTVQLDGLDSFDPTGGTLSDYRWSYTDPSGGEVSLGNQPVILHEFTEANTYSVKLRVSTSQKDSEGYRTAMDGISVLRVRANPPASNVRFRINGIETTDLFHATMQEASAGLSFDPSPTTPALGRVINKYEWLFGDSAGEVRLAPTTVVHTYTKPGEYNVKLQVTDNLGIVDKRIVKVIVKSLAADIRVSPNSGNVNTEFTFAGERSRSDDGFIREYAWSIMDKEGSTIFESTDPSFVYRFQKPGAYKVELVVTDLTGAKDKLMKEVAVVSRPPSANFEFSIPEKNHPARVVFDAIDSYDPDEGDVLSYSWDFDGNGTFDVTNSKEATATFEFKRKGEFKAVLQVEDSFGQRDRLEKKVTINSTLAADIGVDRKTARVGDKVTFKAENSNAAAYLWEFGDGETQSTEEESVTYTYQKYGKYNVKLNFFSSDDEENSDSIRFLVGSGEAPMAVISSTVNGREPAMVDDLCGAGKAGALITRADVVRFDARNSMNTDGSSRLLTYDWKFPNGERFATRETNYKFTEVAKQGECFFVSLVVRDQLSGKISEEDKAYYKVINELPQIVDFVIQAPSDTDLVTPVKIGLRAVNPKDPDGTIKKYKWWYFREGFENEKLGVHNTANPETEMIITSVGEPEAKNKYVFVLEVSDNDNGVYNTLERFGDVSSLEIQNGPNLSPVAEFTLDKSTIAVGDSVTFLSTSYDPQGDPLPNDAFRWDFDGDGQFDDISSGPQVNRQYNTPGEFEVRLRVVNRGLSTSAAHTIVVEAANALPQAAFTYTVDGNKVSFDASSTRFDPALKDPTLRFEWDFDIAADQNGNGVSDDDVESTEMRATHTYAEKGNYKVRLKVKDTLGMEGVVVREVNLNQTAEERLQNATRTLKITAAKQPLTTLEVEVVPALLAKGGSADVTITVLNADGTPYAGKVYFDILEGSGVFTPNPVDAKNSKASSVFTATEEGKVRILIRATDTVYGELTEEAAITVR